MAPIIPPNPLDRPLSATNAAPKRGRFFDPVTGAWHLWVPGVKVPSGVKVVTTSNEGQGRYWDPVTGAWHIYAPGVNLPSGAHVYPPQPGGDIRIPYGTLKLPTPPPPPPPIYPGGAPTATAKLPVRTVAATKPPLKKKSGSAPGPDQITADTVTTDPGATSAAPTTAAPGSSVDPNWILKQLKGIYGSGADPKKLAALASKLAAQAVQAQVAGITTQQQQLQDQGRSQALNILAASRAAANLQNNFGNALNRAYGNAADETRQIAGGYAGNLKDTALAEQSQIAQQVAAAGGTYAPVVPGIADNAYNALYNMQGGIPATSLGGLAAGGAPGQNVLSMQAAQSLPMITRGGGTQTALLAQGAANQASNALFKNIENAKAQLPRLTQSYLQSLTSQEAAQKKNSLAGLSLYLNAVTKGDTTAFNQWLAKAKLGQSGARITQAGQYQNASLKIRAFNAQTQRNSQFASSSATRIRANAAAKKYALALGQSADKLGQRLSQRITDLVKGRWTKPSYSGGRPQLGQLIDQPVSPSEALHILSTEFQSLLGTKQGRELILSELARAYGTRRVIYPPGGPKEGIEVGWNPADPSTAQAFPLGKDGLLFTGDE